MISLRATAFFLMASFFLSPFSSHASTLVSYDSKTYSVSTVEGTYLELEDLLVSQLWWGNEDLAKYFLRETLQFGSDGRVTSLLAWPNESAVYTAYFAHSLSDRHVHTAADGVTYNGFLIGEDVVLVSQSETFSWGVAAVVDSADAPSTVPVPAPLLLLMSGFSIMMCAPRRPLSGYFGRCKALS